MGSPAPTPSQIPVPSNKRASLQLPPSQLIASGSTLPVPNGYAITSVIPNNGSSSRSQSPLHSRIPTGRNMNNGPGNSKRLSLLSVGRRFSGNDENAIPEDVDDHSSQIKHLESSLAQAHQRIIELTKSMKANMSLSTSPGTVSAVLTEDGRPWTPVNGLDGLNEIEGFTPSSVPGFGELELDENEMDDGINDPLRQPTQSSINKARAKVLPHSSPSFDLRRRAATPGEVTPGQFRPGDGRLGLSQIPVSKVTHALSLHATPPATTPASPRPSFRTTTESPPSSGKADSLLRSPFFGPNSPSPSAQIPTSPGGTFIGSNDLGLGRPGPPISDGRISPGLSPNLRRSTGPMSGSAASTRVIDSLQTDLLGVKGHLERVKGEVRSGQRVIESLTRQTEDLKETRERMRVECEGLNNVIARKERLLQEVLERARTAEASLSSHQASRKALEQTTKKSLATMSAQLVDAQQAQAKAEREAASLRDAVKSLRDVWAREVKAVREEWKAGRERGEKEREEARMKHVALVKLVQAQSVDRANIQKLVDTSATQSELATKAFDDQIKALRAQVDRSEAESREAKAIATGLATELLHLRRLMREPAREELNAAASDPPNGT